MKTIFYYKPRYLKGEKMEGEVKGGVEAMRLANLEQTAWETLADYGSRQDALWSQATDPLAADLIVFSRTRIDQYSAAVEDLITKSRYLIPGKYTATEVASLGAKWIQAFLKQRGTWCHVHKQYELTGCTDW